VALTRALGSIKARLLRALLLAAFALAGGVIAYLLVVPPARVEVAASPVAVTLGGHSLSVDGGAAGLERARDAARGIARAFLAGKVTLAVPGGARHDLTREELGARVDPERLEALVRAARHPKSALRRAHAKRSPATPLELPLPVTLDTQRATLALLQIKDETDKPPIEARLDLERNTVSADEPGLRLDVFATLARLDEAFASARGEIEAVVETLRAERTAERLQGIVIDDVLGWFETKYARDSSHDARTFNLRLAASKLNGYVLLPGETFDFNEVVGPRTESMGYRVAPVIASGELVDGVGGGTCQVSGTLHAAAFFAGLEIVERKPHTRPSFYIKMGIDAAVAYPTITLKIKNPYPFPVVLHETVAGGIARAEILGPKRTRDVTFVRKITEVVPFAEKEVTDPKLPRGARQIKQRGIPGFKLTRWRILRDGSFAVREKITDAYPPTVQIWQVGTGEPVPDFKAKDDAHPEYVVDEYLMIAQGPDIHSPSTRGVRAVEKGGGMTESRVAGRTGFYGWTIREGLAKEVYGTGNKPATACTKGDDKCESKAGVD
jgi:vancomycin resistance protein YoaR